MKANRPAPGEHTGLVFGGADAQGTFVMSKVRSSSRASALYCDLRVYFQVPG
jgi:hypothetical protein